MILEILRILGAGLIIQLPVTLCLLVGIVYVIGVKIGTFEEDEE